MNNNIIIEFPNILPIDCDNFLIGDVWHNQTWKRTVIMRHILMIDTLSRIQLMTLNYIFIDMTDFI